MKPGDEVSFEVDGVSPHVGEFLPDIPDEAYQEYERKYDKHEGTRWGLADWLVGYCSKLMPYRGARDYHLRKFSHYNGASYRELDAYERTARYWPPEARKPYEGTKITYSHFRDAGEDRELLHLAYIEGLSVGKMLDRKREIEEGVPAHIIYLGKAKGYMWKVVANIPEILREDAKVSVASIQDLEDKAKGLSDE
jgi:hypothetical protein